MDPVALESLRGVPDPEVGQVVIDPEPALVVSVVVGHDPVGKESQGRIADSGQKPHEPAVRKEVDVTVDTDQIEQDKKGGDQKRDIGVGPDIDQDIDSLQKSQHPQGQALHPLSRPLLPLSLRGRVRVGIGPAEKEVENIDGGKGDKAESHIVPNPVPVDQGRLPDQTDPVKKEDRQIADRAGPEHDLADLAEGNILDRHHHDKELQKGDAGSRHLLDHHQIGEKDRGHGNGPRGQVHVREQDPHQKEEEAEIPHQLAQLRSEKYSESTVIYICLQDPHDQSRKCDQLVEPDPHAFLRDPEPDRSAVKNHRIPPCLFIRPSVFYAFSPFMPSAPGPAGRRFSGPALLSQRSMSCGVSPGSRSQASIPCIIRLSSGGSCI